LFVISGQEIIPLPVLEAEPRVLKKRQTPQVPESTKHDVTSTAKEKASNSKSKPKSDKDIELIQLSENEDDEQEWEAPRIFINPNIFEDRSDEDELVPDVIRENSPPPHKIIAARKKSVTSKSEKNPSSAVQDLDTICNEMAIPDEDYETALDFLKSFETLLAKHKQLPSCRVILFRNWYLKLKNTTSLNEVIFFLDYQGELKFLIFILNSVI